VQAQALAEALTERSEPGPRIERYLKRTRALLRTHFDSAVAADRLFLNRGRLQRGEALPPADRLLNYLYDEAFTPALHNSMFVAREMVKAMEMREPASVLRQAGMVAQVVAAFVGRRFGRALPALPPLGPTRTDLLRALPSAPRVPGSPDGR
jgi:hypothetical protein